MRIARRRRVRGVLGPNDPPRASEIGGVAGLNTHLRCYGCGNCSWPSEKSISNARAAGVGLPAVGGFGCPSAMSWYAAGGNLGCPAQLHAACVAEAVLLPTAQGAGAEAELTASCRPPVISAVGAAGKRFPAGHHHSLQVSC